VIQETIRASAKKRSVTKSPRSARGSPVKPRSPSGSPVAGQELERYQLYEAPPSPPPVTTQLARIGARRNDYLEKYCLRSVDRAAKGFSMIARISFRELPSWFDDHVCPYFDPPLVIDCTHSK
jgi:hypothetical protein